MMMYAKKRDNGTDAAGTSIRKEMRPVPQLTILQGRAGKTDLNSSDSFLFKDTVYIDTAFSFTYIK